MQIDEHYKLILWTVFSSVQQTQPKLSQLSCQHRWKSIIFHYFGLYHVTCGQPFDLPCSCIDGGVNLKVRGLTGTWKGCRHRNAKIWGKKGRFCENLAKPGGGATAPQPPRLRRPCHVAWCRVKYRVRMISYLCISQFQAWPSPWAKPPDNIFDRRRIPHPREKWVQTPSPPLGLIKTS